MKTAYLAGPMRGIDQFNFPAFDAAQVTLEYHGWSVLSPAQMDRDIGFDETRNSLDGFDMAAAIDRDIDAIKACDALVLLPGHEKSRGATAERHLALWLGKDVWAYCPVAGIKELNPQEDILHEAYRLTAGDRNNQYGPPDQDFARTAKMWSAILGCDVRTQDVALCMIALKISRATWMAKRDTAVDMAGYARCYWLCVESARIQATPDGTSHNGSHERI